MSLAATVAYGAGVALALLAAVRGGYGPRAWLVVGALGVAGPALAWPMWGGRPAVSMSAVAIAPLVLALAAAALRRGGLYGSEEDSSMWEICERPMPQAGDVARLRAYAHAVRQVAQRPPGTVRLPAPPLGEQLDARRVWEVSELWEAARAVAELKRQGRVSRWSWRRTCVELAHAVEQLAASIEREDTGGHPRAWPQSGPAHSRHVTLAAVPEEGDDAC